MPLTNTACTRTGQVLSAFPLTCSPMSITSDQATCQSPQGSHPPLPPRSEASCPCPGSHCSWAPAIVVHYGEVHSPNPPVGQKASPNKHSLSMVFRSTESHHGAQLKENLEILQPCFLMFPQFHHLRTGQSSARQEWHTEQTGFLVWSFETLLQPCSGAGNSLADSKPHSTILGTEATGKLHDT
ncbi:hypothetical protein KIL84_014732 [Mauremys mutica]|uniref:Uncharacterized protein n=1 Tax=Mauremys mutica TaxID=74926 RepID=A0A9D3XR89_9SAUR|nr:hypothetical protein KIL84_014732 [Mauremys mutica]